MPRSTPSSPRAGAARASRPTRAVKASAGRRTGDRTPGVLAQLEHIERDGGDGIVVFSPGGTLAVSSLDRVIFPKDGVTKGALMRYYAAVAPVLLPSLADRPLVLERHPRGIAGASFHQHTPGEATPPSVRVEEVHSEDEVLPRFVGGDLPTLLYTVQVGAIAVNPWHARVGRTEHPDYAVLDLDPGPRVPFSRTRRVGQLVLDALDGMGLRAALKTSGSRGIHFVIPLPPNASWADSAALAEEAAARVAREHPALATVERALAARPKGTVYVDHLQNARGKTLASVLSVRAKPGATVSAPFARDAMGTLSLKDWTVATVPPDLARLKRLWQAGIRTPTKGRR